MANSPLASPENLSKPLAMAVDTPLPLSDDSDMFYSPPTHISPPVSSSPNENEETKVPSVIVEEEEDSVIIIEDEVDGTGPGAREEAMAVDKVAQHEIKEDTVPRTGSESFM